MPISRLWWVTAPLLVSFIGAIVVVGSLQVPYYSLAPGSARAVGPLVTISAKDKAGEPVDDDEDGARDILFVTVSARRPSGFEVLRNVRDDKIEVVPQEIITGGQTPAQNTKFNLQLMTDSKDRATKVALERAGYEVKVTSTGAVITDADPTLPVSKVVTPGETVVEADDEPITSAKDLVAVIRAKKPGDTVELRLEPFGPGPARTVTAKVSERPGAPGKPLLGVSLEDRPEYVFPVEVEIDSEKVGGPSAGLAFTLSILDRLTPGDLTGGKKVAVTGTIDLDGSVGPVGGVRQKTEAAIAAGAKVFIVPPDEYHDATEQARGRILIRQASSLDQALTVLRELGGDPVPKVPQRRESD